MKRLVLALMVPAVIAVGVRAQDAPAPSSLAFEVASVKGNTSGGEGMMFRTQPGGRFNVTNVPLKEIIRFAYGVQPFQITGGPDWIGTARWDIVAKADASTPLGPAAPGTLSPIALMLQNLLADRFKLKVHRESREMPVYALVLARSDGTLGPKIERNQTDCAAMARNAGRTGGPPAGPPAPPKPGERPPCGAFMGPGSVAAGAVGISQLATMLSQRVGRTVLDKTGLDGLWSFNLDFAPEFPQGAPPPGVQLPPSDPDAPSLYTALQEQLGLKLDAQRGPVDMLVIDSADHPTED